MHDCGAFVGFAEDLVPGNWVLGSKPAYKFSRARGELPRARGAASGAAELGWQEIPQGLRGGTAELCGVPVAHWRSVLDRRVQYSGRGGEVSLSVPNNCPPEEELPCGSHPEDEAEAGGRIEA